MKVKSTDVAGKLTVRQKYLLDRIPAKYSLNGFQAPPDPPEVAEARKAEKVVAKWDKHVALLRCKHEKQTDALLRKAREAVYFHSEQDALAIIRQVEKLLKTCGD